MHGHRRLSSLLLPLPGIPGRGLGRGVQEIADCGLMNADWKRIEPFGFGTQHSAFSIRRRPLSPALSPEYRGEGGTTTAAVFLLVALLVVLIGLLCPQVAAAGNADAPLWS